ncbi:MAG: 3'(2'),5'-bisphosphate nucleotidase CysQ [Gammaproteobacteria bacterium]|nr:3'(2'),5'-bisphosphate nucleotidase CysQ [Gammaproteobacteria bacterium]
MPLDRELLLKTVAIAEEAGREIMAIYATDFDVEQKADGSPLTAADMAAHRRIVAGLEALADSCPILSEESAHEFTWEARRQWSRHWLVDPLDGTKEFVKKNGEFTVNIALVEQHDVALGVVHVPAKGETYYAAVGVGAFKSENGEERVITVTDPHQTPMRVAGSRSHGNAKTRRFIERLGETRTVAIGSALKLCLVAEGAVDIYPRFGPTAEWDTAAAQCIVEQAGGAVTDLSLAALRYNHKESLLNPCFLVFGDQSTDWRNYMDD